METKKARVASDIPDKIDFKTKAITRDKEGPSNSTDAYLFKEYPNTSLKDICPHMFIATFFTITKVWKQIKYLSIDG